MAFFQNSVLNKHLKGQDTETIEAAYQKFTAYFHNHAIQQNIREAKEEQFQEGFLRELFVNILGYTLNPQPDYNLTTELKNEKGAKKCDGAILQDGKALGVIELKGTDTKDLDKINVQAFNYKNNQTACIYVITSNFEKLRFFIHHSVEHLEFNLFTLTKTKFQLLWLCLRADNLLNGVPLKVKEESLLEEEKITKQLYKDYAAFRYDLWQNMVKNNARGNKLLLFKKTQKLLDRYLFIFFAEDSGLLPPNSISRIVKRWEVLKEEDAYKPLYEIFKQYFGYIDTGRKGHKTIDDIFAYNGGLFQPDELLDSIVIDDEILHPHVMKLTNYDFQSEVDVNILGHIFENSLNEIENITAQIEGQEIDKSKTLLDRQAGKRKKDGVFYTPKYITKYIVDNTVGKLCEEKKAELGIIDEEYDKGRRNRKKDTIKRLDENLQAYRSWLLNITICDPACGSGAFLNQALEFLMDEHAYIDELQAQLFGASIVFQDVSNHILEKNIFGVDINEESVDIAKLSLWLRTAQRGRKLTTLNHNIKYGNSLIDDPDVAGEKAFNWQKEFPGVFKEKVKKPFHITWVTHNSRTSQRMIDHKVKKGDPFWMEDEYEEVVAKTIADIVKQDNLNVMAYNSCGDHIHLLLVCEKDEIPNIVRKLKGKSSQKLKEHLQIPKEEQFVLWAQKYSTTYINSEEQLWNTIEYIRNNRLKHELHTNKGLQPLVGSGTMQQTYDHAFRTEYKGGFDVVIGNPPYVSKSFDDNEKKYFNKNYETAQYQLDLYISFMELGTKILCRKGFISYIVPNSWLKNLMFDRCRSFLQNNLFLRVIVPNLENVFADASVDTMIFTGVKEARKNNELEIGRFQQYIYHKKHNIDQARFSKNSKLIFDVEISKESESIFEKIENQCSRLKEVSDVTRGINPYDKYRGQSPEAIKNKLYHSDHPKDKTFVPEIRGKHVNRYSLEWDGISYVSYGKWLAAPREPKFFEGNRIICRQILSKNLNCTFLDTEFIIDQSVFIAKFSEEQSEKLNPKFVLAQLTSTLIGYYFRYKANEFDALFPKIKIGEYNQLPVKLADKETQNKLAAMVDNMLHNNFLLNKTNTYVLDLLQSKFSIERLSKKLQNWHKLEFKDFIKELKKAKVQLSLTDEAEWMQYFNEQKQKAQELITEINRVDAEIDKMVYELYGLTEEEIKIVEGK